MVVVLRPGEGTEPDVLCCQLCGRTRPFEPGLPYVNQSSAFSMDHECGELEGDGPFDC